MPTYTNYSLPTPVSTMSSSTAFRQQVTQLLSDFTRCYELCDAILTNRRLGSTHESFDRLRDGLHTSAVEIQLRFNTLRKVIGSRMDHGDDKARSAMENIGRDTQTEIHTRLFDIAYKKQSGRNSPDLPGFRELLRRLRIIEREAIDTLESLGQRLGGPKRDEKKKPTTKTPKTPKTYEVKPAAETYVEQQQTEEVTIRLQDLDTLLKHMKNSWVEKWVGGNVLYINKFDSARTQWEKPTGYIKQLPRSSRHSSATSSQGSRDSRRSSADSWEVPQRRKTAGW